jgi:LysM repeat protein
MKVSKVVIIVVALHVLVIGGIFIFEGCTRTKAPVPDIASSGSTDETAANQTNLAAATPDNSAALPPVAPPAVPTAPQAVPQSPAPTPIAKSYVVKKGDTLWKVAKEEHVTVADLAKANNLTKTSALKINQKLTIPAKAEAAPVQMASAAPAAGAVPSDVSATAATPAGGNAYIVKQGDSLWKIAKAEHVSVAALKQANNLTSDSLKISQKLTIPAAAAGSSAAPAAPASASSAPAPQASAATASYGAWEPGAHTENGQTFHTVDINENLTVIAKKYGVKVDDLVKANNLNGKQIVAGQKLVIPAAATPAASVPSATPAIATPIVTSNN